jgi:hypothetical protein
METPSCTPTSPLGQLTHICPIGALGNVYPYVVLMQIGIGIANIDMITPSGGQTTLMERTGRGKSAKLPVKGETRGLLLAPKYSIIRVKCLCCWPVRNECIPGMRSDGFEWICSKFGVRTYQRLTETLGFPAVQSYRGKKRAYSIANARRHEAKKKGPYRARRRCDLVRGAPTPSPI